ncbi:MAG: hypothetical protein R3E12_12980 [Candidatus Eisenbacteria bacterium]|uniref:Uncharacterized protein n=1 Tax=Eiseniibacteriota bacterium TaxID=2212470 RepID=A0A956M276_UNCEI|nr:hypothetical protein [Candidatus Eisenbacteria bacterium]
MDPSNPPTSVTLRSPSRALLWVFLASLAVRLLWVVVFGSEPSCTDSVEYFQNSANLELVVASHGETSVWQHNPGMILWAHLVHPFFPWAQALIGAATCAIVEALVPGSGWLLAFWLPHIAATGLWLKWIIAGFGVSVAWAIFRRWWWSAIPLSVVLIALFWSLVGQNVERDAVSPLWRLAGFWMPITELGGQKNALLLPFSVCWLVLLPGLLRVCRTWSGLLLVGGLSLGAILTFGVAQQRLPFEPILLSLIVEAAPEKD